MKLHETQSKHRLIIFQALEQQPDHQCSVLFRCLSQVLSLQQVEGLKWIIN
jgi:hypothetical protein